VAWASAGSAAQDRLQELRGHLAVWRDPVYRHQRRKRWARRSLTVRALATVGLIWATTQVGSAPGVEASEVLVGAATCVVAVGTARAARKVWRLERAAPPAFTPPPAPLPPRGSVARPALDRLAERERALGGLLTHLGSSADDIRPTAADAAAALRELGSRVAAVDAARQGAGASARGPLDSAVAALVRQLDQGVEAYDALVVAAADALSASATLRAGDPALTRRLTEATDALAGLAAGLREVTQ
jgi:hypothetical protein